jgi:hypothetical protein
MIEKKNSKQIFIIFALFIIIILLIFRNNNEKFAGIYTTPKKKPQLTLPQINKKREELRREELQREQLQREQLIKLEIEKEKLRTMLSELNSVSIDKLNIQNSFRIGDNILFSPTEMHITTSNRSDINMDDANSSIRIGDQTLDYDKIRYINELYNSRINNKILKY